MALKIVIGLLVVAAIWVAGAYSERFVDDALFPGFDSKVEVSVNGNKLEILHDAGSSFDCMQFELVIKEIDSFPTAPIASLPFTKLRTEIDGKEVRVTSGSAKPFRWSAGHSITIECKDQTELATGPWEMITDKKGNDSQGLQYHRWYAEWIIWILIFVACAATAYGVVNKATAQKPKEETKKETNSAASELVLDNIRVRDCLEALVLTVKTDGIEEDTRIMQGLLRNAVTGSKSFKEAKRIEIKKGANPGQVLNLWPEAQYSFQVNLTSLLRSIDLLRGSLAEIENKIA